MFKNHCRICGRTIENHDFYMDTAQGKICSSCLTAKRVSSGVTALFARSREQISSRREDSPPADMELGEQGLQNCS